MAGKMTTQRLVAALCIVLVAVAIYILRPAAGSDAGADPESRVTRATALPRLLDLGADKCVPCKMMAPILEEMKTTYAGRLTVDFIDVWKHPQEAEPYNIRVIPTQIFFASDGTELFRHEGFFSREDILAKWHELGVDLPESGA